MGYKKNCDKRDEQMRFKDGNFEPTLKKESKLIPRANRMNTSSKVQNLTPLKTIKGGSPIKLAHNYQKYFFENSMVDTILLWQIFSFKYFQ